MKLRGLKLKCLLAGRPGVHHGPRQKVPFGSGGESQLQTLVRGAARAAFPKEGAAHLLPSGGGGTEIPWFIETAGRCEDP